MPDIAIACQGGGSHTAFTAGVLQSILQDAAEHRGYRITGLSGTSGGALNALLVWYHLLRGEPEAGAQVLEDFWMQPYPYGNAAVLPPDYVMNQWIVQSSTWPIRYESSPYATQAWLSAVPPETQGWAAMWMDGHAALRHLLTRYVDFDSLPNLVRDRTDPAPELYIGAVEIKEGRFVRFQGTHPDFSAESVIASATLPEIMRTLEIREGAYAGAYWDGLFSENPPVSCFCESGDGMQLGKPDEIWVIRINPRHRSDVPRSLSEIHDRRNELAGNMSLEHGLAMIEKINELVEPWVGSKGGTKKACPDNLRKYKIIQVREIAMREDLADALSYPSKFDRSLQHLNRLMEDGRAQGRAFLESWRPAG